MTNEYPARSDHGRGPSVDVQFSGETEAFTRLAEDMAHGFDIPIQQAAEALGHALVAECEPWSVQFPETIPLLRRVGWRLRWWNRRRRVPMGSWSEHVRGDLVWSGTIYPLDNWVAGAGAIAPEHNWADAQTVEAESPLVDTEHCWRCEVATVPREDDVGLCETCKGVLRDLTRPTVPDRVLLVPDASNGWFRIPFPPDVVIHSGEEFTFEVERDAAADAFRVTVLTTNGILSQFTVGPISHLLA